MNKSKANTLIQEGRHLLKLGEADLAAEKFKLAIKLDRHSFEGWLQLGQFYMQRNRFVDAKDCFRSLVDIDRSNLAAQGNLAICCYHLQQLDEAIAGFRNVVNLQPNNATALRYLAVALLDKGERMEAADRCDQAIKAQPDFAYSHFLRGSIHAALGEFRLAAASHSRASKLEPGWVTALAGEANALIKLGQTEKAMELIAPHTVDDVDDVALAIAYASLHTTHKCPDRAAAHLEKLLANPSLNHNDCLQLHFSAGKLYDRTGMYDKAFDHYRTGNQYVKRNYNRSADKARMEQTKSAFDRNSLTRLAQNTVSGSGPTPVFIVGMPRSGTSLVEKILSRHIKVKAGGEMPCIPEIAFSLLDRSGEPISFPENILDADINNIQQHIRIYRQQLKAFAKGSTIVTDKLPHNFLFLGLIQMLLPDARIVHCRRNVLDTCLSNYFQLFSGPIDYAYNLEDIADHYNHYSELMAHWRQTLDLDMFEIDYEALVVNQEETTRKLVDFCGLEWDPGCLTFHESSEPTRTASYDQVRQPMYRHSVGRWQHYESYLEPLTRNLTPSLVRREK